MDVEERLLLDRVALHAADVSPGNIQPSALVEADFADAGLAFGNRAFVAAGITAQPIGSSFSTSSGAASATF